MPQVVPRNRSSPGARAPGSAASLGTTRPRERRVVSFDAALNLRHPDACQALSLEHTSSCFADLEFARATSRIIYSMTETQALLALSMGFLDDFGRRSLVVFLGSQPPDPGSFVSTVTPRRPLRWG